MDKTPFRPQGGFKTRRQAWAARAKWTAVAAVMTVVSAFASLAAEPPTGAVPADIAQAAADVNATFTTVSGIIIGVVLFFTAVKFIRRIK